MNGIVHTRGLRHVALRVRDLGRAKAFYVGVFGMQTVWEPDAENCYLSSGCDNLALHVAPALRPTTEGADALDHIGFIVTSPDAVWEAAAALRQRHINIIKEPQHHRDGSCSLYCADPDGNVVQILYEPSISPLTFQ